MPDKNPTAITNPASTLPESAPLPSAEQRGLAQRLSSLEAKLLRRPASAPLTPLPHLPALDGIRGIAIALVLIHHFFSFKSSPRLSMRLAGDLTQSLWVGVDLFFVLSGFLLTRILLNAPKTKGYFYNFYARRFLRIAPLYFLVLAGCLSLVLLKIAPASLGIPRSIKPYAAMLLYLTNFATVTWGAGIFGSLFIFWSLAVEEHFYLVWPLMTYHFSRFSLLGVSAALIVAAEFCRLCLWALHVPPISIYCLTFCRMDCLAGGAALAVVYLSVAPGKLLLTSQLIIPASLAGLLYIAARAGGLPILNESVQLIGFPLVALLMTGLVMFVLAAPAAHPVSRFCRTTAMRWLGKYSYGIYVFHTMILDWTIHTFTTAPGTHLFIFFGVLRPVVGISLALAAAWISYNTLEKRMLRLKPVFSSPA